MTCYLAQKDDVHLGVKKVGRALAEVCLQHYSQRKTNPIPYCADYFGHKLYMDQNEKLMVYGVTHVLAIAGHSHSIAAFSTMPIKNNAKCYDEVYRYVFYSLEFQTLSEESCPILLF